MVYLLKIVIFYSYVKLPGRVNPMISWKIRPRHEANVTGRWASFDGDADRVADPVKILGNFDVLLLFIVNYMYILYT